MSLFLGPIHYWLYNKIELQNRITENIIKSLNIEEIRKDLDEKYGYLDNKPLEDMIDTQNIHGWLQEKVNVVENRLAYVTKYALDKDIKNIDKIKEIFFNFGRDIKIDNKEDAQVIFKAIDDNLLDGMPCDRAKNVLDKNQDFISFERRICVHKKYWDNINIDINIYYDFVDSFINGILEDTKFIFVKENDNIFSIKKKEL